MKAKAEQLVANLLKAYDEDIRTITWMSATTRQKALENCIVLRRISVIRTNGGIFQG